MDDHGAWTCHGLQLGFVPYRGCQCPGLRYMFNNSSGNVLPWDYPEFVGVNVHGWEESKGQRVFVVEVLEDFLKNLHAVGSPGDFLADFVAEHWWIFPSEENANRWQTNYYYTNPDFRFTVLAASLPRPVELTHRAFLRNQHL